MNEKRNFGFRLIGDYPNMVTTESLQTYQNSRSHIDILI